MATAAMEGGLDSSPFSAMSPACIVDGLELW